VINQALPLALICALLLAGCSTKPTEEELAAARAAGEQAALQMYRLQEQEKTRAFVDSYGHDSRLLALISEHGFELEQRADVLSISIPVDNYFNINRQANTLLPAALPRISQLVNLLQNDPEASLLVLGHLDPELADKNSKLSGQQAQAVAAIFKLAGFGRERLMFKGVGADMPRAANDSVEGRKLNRRVELLLTRQSTLQDVLRSYSELSQSVSVN